MGRPAVPPTHGAIGCALAASLSLVWGVETQPIEKQRGGRGLGLRWPLFGQETQQPTESWRLLWVGYWGGRATTAERVGGAFCYRLGRRINRESNGALDFDGF